MYPPKISSTLHDGLEVSSHQKDLNMINVLWYCFMQLNQQLGDLQVQYDELQFEHELKVSIHSLYMQHAGNVWNNLVLLLHVQRSTTK